MISHSDTSHIGEKNEFVIELFKDSYNINFIE